MFHPINLITTYLVHYMQLSEFSKVSLLHEDFMSQIVMLTVCQKTHKLIHSSVIMVRQKCINNSTMVASLECKTLSLKDESCPIFKVYHYLSSYTKKARKYEVHQATCFLTSPTLSTDLFTPF